MLTEKYLMTLVPERFLTDERYRNGHINILATKEGTRVLGMHSPEMKQVAKELVKNDTWKEQLTFWTSRQPLTGRDGLSHEERMIWGLIIDYVKVTLTERLQLIDDFIPAIDNWAVCDTFCCNAKWAEKEDKTLVWEFLKNKIMSSDEFTARTGIVMALAHFLDDKNIDNTLETIARRGLCDNDAYYIRMGVAWLFAEALCKQYETALPYIENHHLSRWIHNKAIQKATESFRISTERKSYLRSQKY